MFDAVVIAIVRGVSTDNWVTDCGGQSALKPNYLGPTATAALRCRWNRARHTARRYAYRSFVRSTDPMKFPCFRLLRFLLQDRITPNRTETRFVRIFSRVLQRSIELATSDRRSTKRRQWSANDQEPRERTTLLYRKLNYKECKRGKVDARGWNKSRKGRKRRERGRRRSPGTKNKASFVAVARGAIRPAFQLTGWRCFRVQPCRKLGLFTRRLRDESRGERKLATINFKNQFRCRTSGRHFSTRATGDEGRDRVVTNGWWLLRGMSWHVQTWKKWMASMVIRSTVAAPSRPRAEALRVRLRFLFFGGLPFWTKIPIRRDSLLSVKFIVDTESRILRNNSIAATLYDVPHGRLKLFPSQGERDRECLRPTIINVLFENVFENSSHFIATVNRTIRSTFIIITFDSFLRDTRERRNALSWPRVVPEPFDRLAGYFRDYRLVFSSFPLSLSLSSRFRDSSSTPPFMSFRLLRLFVALRPSRCSYTYRRKLHFVGCKGSVVKIITLATLTAPPLHAERNCTGPPPICCPSTLLHAW